MGEELSRDERETLNPHEHDLGAGCLRDHGEVDAGRLLTLHHVTGEDGEHRVVLAVCDRNAGVGETADDGADAGDDLKAKPCGRKLGGLLTSPPEDAWIAPLEADDPLSLACVAEQLGVGLLLLHRVTARSLASIDQLR